MGYIGVFFFLPKAMLYLLQGDYIRREQGNKVYGACIPFSFPANRQEETSWFPTSSENLETPQAVHASTRRSNCIRPFGPENDDTALNVR